MKSKAIKISIIVGVGIFLSFTLLWFIVMNLKYSRFTDRVKKNEAGLHYYVTETGRAFYVKKPNFLSFTGNLVVSNYVKEEEKNKDEIYLGEVRLFIWPSFFTNNFKYGVIIIDENKKYFIDLDKEMKAIDSNYNDLISKYSREISDLFYSANTMWGIESN
jgi:hypothetical protein